MKSFYKSIFMFFITSTLVLGQKSKAISIEQFGAIGDGKSLNTLAIQKQLTKPLPSKMEKLFFQKVISCLVQSN